MSNTVLVIGPSGSGKSTSIRNLDHKSTFLISILNKPLPIRGYKNRYSPIKGWDDMEGNFLATDDWQRIIKCIDMVNKTRRDISTIILDDAQYIMSHEYMKRATEKGFSKFSEIAQHMWTVINALIATREDLTCFVLAHNEIDVNGQSKAKTIGKMLDEKITLEGMFTCVLHTAVSDNQYRFITQHDGVHTAKTPMGLFDEGMIDNDLEFVRHKLEAYFNEETYV